MVVVGAGNPANDDAYDTAQLDAAVCNRYVHIKVHYDAKALVAYAKKKGWHANVVSFIQVNGNKLFASTDYDGLPFCSPRALESLSQMEAAGLGRDKPMHAMLAQGCIGPELGLEYHAHCFDLRPVKWTELASKDGMERAARMADETNYRADLLSFTNDDIVEQFSKKGAMTDKDFKILSDYICTIRADQGAALVAQIQSIASVRDAFRDHVKANGKAITDHLGKLLTK